MGGGARRCLKKRNLGERVRTDFMVPRGKLSKCAASEAAPQQAAGRNGMARARGQDRL